MRSVLDELKRRRVLKTAAWYAAAAWAATEMLGFLLPALNFPRWTITVVAIVFVVGFPVAMFLAWVFDIEGDGISRTAAASARGKATITLAVIFLVGSTVGLFYLIYPDGAGNDKPASAVAFNPPRHSIAVLPFVNMSDDREARYFGDGIAEEVLHRLTRNINLRVTARTSSFQYRDRTLDVRAIGEQLNVAQVLEGSVRKTGSKVRITVQLIDTRDGYHVWSETYDRQLQDIFEIQEEIAESINEKLSVEMVVASRGLEERAHISTDPENYDLYLRARELVYQGDESNVEKSIEKLELVLASDPGFAYAWLTLANAHFALNGQQEEYDDRILESARKALELDPSLGEANLVMAQVYERQWKWISAEQQYRRALALGAGDAKFHHAYGVFLSKTGALQRSSEQLSLALQRDPLSESIHLDVARLLLLEDKLDAALGYVGHTEIDDSRSREADEIIVQILLGKGDLNKALAVSSEGRASYGPGFWPEILLLALDDSSQRDPALSELATLLHSGELSNDQVFVYYIWLGDLDAAHQSAMVALTSNSLRLDQLWGPAFLEFRKDQRFSRFVREAGLAEYWQVHGCPKDLASSDHDPVCRSS